MRNVFARFFRTPIYILFFSFALSPLFATASTYKAHIVNITKDEYGADNKNWSIDEDEKGIVYFANDLGLLEFDGIEWQLYKSKNNLSVKSVAALSHNTIFTGSYEEFGRWDRDVSGELKYSSLSGEIESSYFNNDEFWNILITDECVYFQSFTSIYLYDYETVSRVDFDRGFLFLHRVHDTFLVQQIGGPLYWLEGNKLRLVEGGEMFAGSDVKVILPYGEDEYLIGASYKGLYIYDGERFEEWSPQLSNILRYKDLNCGILGTNGNYYFGTIIDGIYVVDSDGEVVDHISYQGAIQSNTILSLYEDSNENIWAALDGGITYIQYRKDMSYYISPKSHFGVIYDAISWDGKFFIATNRGVFYIEGIEMKLQDALSRMKLIDGTEGQVWSLHIADDLLYCGHNKGLKRVNKSLRVEDAYSIGTGVYNLTTKTIEGKEYFILSTYNSLRVVDKETDRVTQPWGVNESIVQTFIDHLDNLWLEHASKGVYRCRLDKETLTINDYKYYGEQSDSELPFNLRLFMVGGRVMLLGDDTFYVYDDITDQFILSEHLNDCFENITDLRNVVSITRNTFWVLSQRTIYKLWYDGYQADILESYSLNTKSTLVNKYENVAILSNDISLVCLDNGFILLKNEHSRGEDRDSVKIKITQSPFLKFVESRSERGQSRYYDVESEEKIPFRFNSITFGFSAPHIFSSELYFQYKLEGLQHQEWTDLHQTNKISFERLPHNDYRFMLRLVDDMGNNSEVAIYPFSIKPPWYLTWWASMLYVILALVIFYAVWVFILSRYRNIHLKKIRQRETQRLRHLNYQLERDIQSKRDKIFSQSSFLILKNQLIIRIKNIVDRHHGKDKSEAMSRLHREINALLDREMNSEEDWMTFLIQFEEKYNGYLMRLKAEYPQLTNNDLRLCACLRLNLDTKEIAALLNVSTRSVENNRYRLRKKLDFEPSDNLYDFLFKF